MTDHRYRRILPYDGYALSELPDAADVSHIPDNPRSIHTLFAILLNDVDRSDMSQDLKVDVIKGLVQAWTYHAEQTDTDDVVVELYRDGLETEIVENEK